MRPKPLLVHVPPYRPDERLRCRQCFLPACWFRWPAATRTKAVNTHTLHAGSQHTRSTPAYVLPSCKLPVEAAVLLHHALGLLFKVLSRVIAPPVEHVAVLVEVAPCEKTKWRLRGTRGPDPNLNRIRLNYFLGSHRCRRSHAWSRVRWPFLFRRS